MAYTVLFYVVSAMILISATAVAFSRNIVYSAFALMFSFMSIAAVYAMLSADFIAVTQLLLYVGGILVLILFAIMLTHRIEEVKLSNPSITTVGALLISVAVLAVLV